MMYLLTALYSVILVGALAFTVTSSLTPQTKSALIKKWSTFGFFSNFIILSAYYVTLPIDQVPVLVGFLLITVIISFLSFALGLLYVPIAYVIWISKGSHYLQFGASLVAFIIAEIARPYLFTILTWGSGSTFGAHGSTWSLGSVLASTPLIAFAHYGGVFTLSFILMYTISIAMYPFKKRIKACALGILFLAWIGVRYEAYISEKPINLKIGLIQTSFPHVPEGRGIDETYRERVNETIHPLIMSLAKDGPELIILPEDIRYLDLLSENNKNELKKAFLDALIVDGATRNTKEGRKNVSIMYDTKIDTTYLRNKEFMFPFGEYVPYFLKGIISLAIGEQRLAQYERVHEYTSGDAPYAQQTRFGVIGALICSELTSHDAAMSLKASQPDIAIVQSSLTWTHGSSYYMMNHILALKILAVTLGKPVISVTNSGPLVIIDSYGHMTSFEDDSFGVDVYSLQNQHLTKIR